MPRHHHHNHAGHVLICPDHNCWIDHNHDPGSVEFDIELHIDCRASDEFNLPACTDRRCHDHDAAPAGH